MTFTRWAIIWCTAGGLLAAGNCPLPGDMDMTDDDNDPTACRCFQSDQQVEVDVKFITIEDRFFEQLGVDFDIQLDVENSTYEPTTFAPAEFTNDPVGAFLEVPPGQTSPGALNTLPALSESIGDFSFLAAVLDDLQASAFIRMVEESSGQVLAAPRIITNGGQAAQMILNNEARTPDELDQAFNDEIQVIDNQIPFVNTGVTLEVIPIVRDDGTVQLEIRPTLAVTFQTPDVQGLRPLIQGRNVTTMVELQDGQTVVLGGVINNETNETTQSTVPILNRVPVLNRLFENRQYVTDETTLLVFVTPRIVMQQEQ